MDMIERVARAICREEMGSLKHYDGIIAEGARDMARAALEAMREPTEAMMDAGDVWADGPGYSHKVINAMIDAALQSASSQSPPLEKA